MVVIKHTVFFYWKLRGSLFWGCMLLWCLEAERVSVVGLLVAVLLRS